MDEFGQFYGVRTQSRPVFPATPFFAGGFQKSHHGIEMSRRPEKIHPDPVAVVIKKVQEFGVRILFVVLDHVQVYGSRN